MKKIALLSLIGFVLTGCGDDKVTKEYLVGDWRCKNNPYQRHNVGVNEDLGDPVSSIEDTVTFRIIDNELYRINKEHGNTLVDLNKNDITEYEIIDTYKAHIFNTIKAIDKDTFKSITTIDIKEIDNDDIIQLEWFCTRIK